jgi:pilus assembly protein TadC
VWIIANVIEMLVRLNPQLKRTLRIAHIKQTPQQFMKRAVMFSLYAGFGIVLLLFFLFSKAGISIALLLVMLPLIIIICFFFVLQTPKGAMRKREREINKEVLFAGRYLLVKLESGEPLFNSLIDASKTYGVCAKYFKEIVDDINTGVPIEKALENARAYSTSKKFKKVLWQIVATIKTGTDVTNALRSTLKGIAQEQIIEIKQYAKKLNALMMFYMVIACVAPSLGMTMFIILSGFLNITISTLHFIAVIFFLAVLQLMFLVMIKSSRPMVNL